MSTLKLKKLSPFGVEVRDFEFNAKSVRELREIALENSLVLIRKSGLEQDQDLVRLAQRLSFKRGGIEDKVLHWDFGPVMNMKFDPGARNYLFSDEEVPFHWDGAFHREPQFLVFLCQKSEGAGGETLFANTERIWLSLDPLERDALSDVELTFLTEKKAHYGGQVRVPLKQTHPLRGNTVLRLAEEVSTSLNPVQRELHGSHHEAEDLVELLTHRAYAPEFCYRHEWETGDLLIADNFSLIHGRRPLGQNLERSFKRVQVL